MKRISFVAVVVAAVALGACTAKDGSIGSGTKPSLFSNHNSTVLLPSAAIVINNVKVNQSLDNENQLAAALDAIGNSGNPTGAEKIHKRIQILEQKNANSDPVRGMSSIFGAYGRGVITASKSKLKNQRFDNRVKSEVFVHGKILDYSVAADGSGLLQVETYIENHTQNPGGQQKVRIEAYRWSVVMSPGTFEVHGHSGDPADPFPGTLPFPSEVIDRIEQKQFKYKLWAKGMGIRIVNVEYDGNFNPRNPNFRSLNPNSPRYQNLYRSTPDSCVDMLFVEVPPSTFQELEAYVARNPDRLNYCLGRCDHPYLINTGL